MKNTRPMRAELPVDVWDRLASEAAAAGVPVGRYLRNLIVKRDARMHPQDAAEPPASASRVSGNNPTDNPTEGA